MVLGSGGLARAQSPVNACIDAAEDAQRQRKAGHLLAARSRTADCLDPRCPETIRHDCDDLRSDVARRIPSIVLRVRTSDGSELPNAVVQVDGSRALIDGRAREIDPGPHDVLASAPGFVAARRSIVAEEAAAAVVVELRLAALARSPAAPSSSSTPATVTWITSGGLAALGLTGLGLFAGLGLSTDADYRHLRDTCEPGCSASDRDSIHRRFQFVDVALTVGLVASAAAVLVYVIGPRRDVSVSDRDRAVARDR